MSRAELEKTHQASLQILEKTGALVRSSQARALLRKAGATIHEKEMRVFFPQDLVKDAIASAPKAFVLGARNPKRDLKVPSDSFPYMCTDGFPVKIWDHGLQAPRPSTREDLAKWVSLADAVDSVDFVWPSATPTDLPPHLQFIGGLRTSFECTEKHVQYQAVKPEEARVQIAMANAVAGSEDENRKRPHYSAVYCVIAPLQYDSGPTDAIIEFARAGLPVVAMTMVTPGITGPTTLAGTMALANAEVLGALVISQLARRGAPVFYCFVCAPLDMKSGGFASGAPEYGLLSAAGAELARYHGLPAMMGAMGSSAKTPGIQLGFEKGITTATAAFAGGDLLTGVGGLNDALFVSMEQMLIDVEIWEHVKRTARGLEVSDAEIALDVIASLGPRGQYLNHPHTFQNFRKLYVPRYSEHLSYEAWEATGKQEMYETAHAEVERILATHHPEPLPPDVRQQLVEIEKQAGKVAV